VWGCGLKSSDSEDATVVGCSEHSNEPSGSVKGKDFFD